MEDTDIMNIAYGHLNVWRDVEIGEFVRRALTEDITQEDLEKEMGLYEGERREN